MKARLRILGIAALVVSVLCSVAGYLTGADAATPEPGTLGQISRVFAIGGLALYVVALLLPKPS